MNAHAQNIKPETKPHMLTLPAASVLPSIQPSLNICATFENETCTALLRLQFTAEKEASANHNNAHTLNRLKRALKDFLNGNANLKQLPFTLKPTFAYKTATPFQQKVWAALLAIHYAETVHYGAIAKRIGHPKAHRAVGTAVGANPIAVFIPCHRVLPATGGVGKYAYGAPIKKALLQAEGARV